MSRSRLVNLIGIAIGVAGIAFVTSRIIRDRDAIADAMACADLGWLVVGGGPSSSWADGSPQQLVPDHRGHRDR